MNKKLALVLFVLAALILFQFCKSSGRSSVTTANTFPVIKDPAFVFPHRHPVHIDSAFIAGSILNLSVNYSGGCKKHFFKLSTNGTFTESLPPQLDLYLDDTVKTDNCREFKEEMVRFDVSQLKHSSQKAIVLKLTDGHSIQYNY